MNERDFLDIFQKQIKKRKGLKTIALATMSEEGPRNRTVVLRGFKRKQHKCMFYTHELSKKVQEIKAHPKVCLLWYFPKKQIQIQFFGEAQIIQEEERLREFFIQINPSSLKDYKGLPPGTLFQENTNELYFSAVEVEINRYVFLKLGVEEHQKLEYCRNGEEFLLRKLIP